MIQKINLLIPLQRKKWKNLKGKKEVAIENRENRNQQKFWWWGFFFFTKILSVMIIVAWIVMKNPMKREKIMMLRKPFHDTCWPKKEKEKLCDDILELFVATKDVENKSWNDTINVGHVSLRCLFYLQWSSMTGSDVSVFDGHAQ